MRYSGVIEQATGDLLRFGAMPAEAWRVDGSFRSEVEEVVAELPPQPVPRGLVQLGLREQHHRLEQGGWIMAGDKR